ncbi:MAG: hypothetical protein QMD22_09745 [archaeon]|nr:hypothetical protein [archaeon]
MAEEMLFAEREKDSKIYTGVHEILDEKTAALAFIAPYAPAKVTPTKIILASVDIPEELGIEDAINEIRKEKIEKLYLLLNSLGGGVSSSFKIARILRDNFKEITVFIPHIAASGGTLIALIGNKIVMGEMAHLSPIDIQVERNGKLYSVNAMIRSFGHLNDLFKTTPEEDAPYPWKAMSDKLDPVEFQDWIDASHLMETHAKEILKHENSSLKEKADEIIDRLSSSYPSHSYSIAINEAEEIFGNNIVVRPETCPEVFEIMRTWLKKYVLKESALHFIRYILPKKKNGEEKSEE